MRKITDGWIHRQHCLSFYSIYNMLGTEEHTQKPKLVQGAYPWVHTKLKHVYVILTGISLEKFCSIIQTVKTTKIFQCK